MRRAGARDRRTQGSRRPARTAARRHHPQGQAAGQRHSRETRPRRIRNDRDASPARTTARRRSARRRRLAPSTRSTRRRSPIDATAAVSCDTPGRSASTRSSCRAVPSTGSSTFTSVNVPAALAASESAARAVRRASPPASRSVVHTPRAGVRGTGRDELPSRAGDPACGRESQGVGRESDRGRRACPVGAHDGAPDLRSAASRYPEVHRSAPAR